MDSAEHNTDLQSVLRMNAELVELVNQQQNVILNLREKLELYRRKLFGRSSERHVDDPSQLRLFDQGLAPPEAEAEEESEDDGKPKGGRRKRKKKLANIADLVAPFLRFMSDRIRSGCILGVDDTSVRMQDASLPGKMRTARFWLYRGQEDNPYNIFEFHESRGRDGPAAFLESFSGYA